MPQLISWQEVQSTGQIFLPQPAILHGIVPSPSDLVHKPAFFFIVYNTLDLIFLVVYCNTRIWWPLLGPTRHVWMQKTHMENVVHTPDLPC